MGGTEGSGGVLRVGRFWQERFLRVSCGEWALAKLLSGTLYFFSPTPHPLFCSGMSTI